MKRLVMVVLALAGMTACDVNKSPEGGGGEGSGYLPSSVQGEPCPDQTGDAFCAGDILQECIDHPELGPVWDEWDCSYDGGYCAYYEAAAAYCSYEE